MSEVETTQKITLTDEDGAEHEFDVLEMLEVDQKMYAILQPTDAQDEEAVILRVEKDEEGNDVLAYIEDDAEWDKVAEEYDTLLFEEQGGSDEDLQ
ncbi:hypothetical protein CIG75_06970 [Tumebacillus algifaecis]|uniref:UPF0473 protein CIG75_06970 n=1 Tax=Tumebacillus algifaecis TaxID=1214604 RepID=A0A223CZF1_9BACL|nr:DUF1292 domain-containing protein [Tumebacillus algifaecis]ASS74740.1 hypothetical protein CIG75_06970 [Tumebacillus algifaecis]